MIHFATRSYDCIVGMNWTHRRDCFPWSQIDVCLDPLSVAECQIFNAGPIASASRRCRQKSHGVNPKAWNNGRAPGASGGFLRNRRGGGMIARWVIKFKKKIKNKSARFEEEEEKIKSRGQREESVWCRAVVRVHYRGFSTSTSFRSIQLLATQSHH